MTKCELCGEHCVTCNRILKLAWPCVYMSMEDSPNVGRKFIRVRFSEDVQNKKNWLEMFYEEDVNKPLEALLVNFESAINNILQESIKYKCENND